MPTTRFASTATKTESTHVVDTVALQEARNEAFNSRKKRDSPTTASPKQLIMIQWIESIIDSDKQHLLWTKGNEDAITLSSIIDNVYKTKYKDFTQLQSDMSSFCYSIVQSIQHSRSEINALQKLYSLINSSLKFEASRFQEELGEATNIFELVSLVRPAIDGFAFSDMIIKNSTLGPIHDYPSSVQELIVHASLPVEKSNVPTLKQVVAPPPKYHTKINRHEDKPVVPVQWLDFGAFSSFAPCSDSNNANATYENTCMGRSAKRLKSNRKSNQAEQEEIAKWLSSENIDINLVEAAIHQQPEDITEQLQHNSLLLEELVRYQNDRFSQDKSKWSEIDESEAEIAKTLEKSISNMMSKLPPKDTVAHTDTLELAMEQLPLLESSYRGTLPPHKIFSYPTTEKAEVLPPYANITPTYAKENWRLIKVSPVPSKDMKQASLVSMVEQQQHNFYQKPVQQQPSRIQK